MSYTLKLETEEPHFAVLFYNKEPEIAGIKKRWQQLKHFYRIVINREPIPGSWSNIKKQIWSFELTYKVYPDRYRLGSS